MPSQTQCRETVISTNCFDVLLLSHYLSSNILHLKYRQPPFVELIIIYSGRFHLQCEPSLPFFFPPCGHLLNNLSLFLSQSYSLSLGFVCFPLASWDTQRQTALPDSFSDQSCLIWSILPHWRRSLLLR